MISDGEQPSRETSPSAILPWDADNQRLYNLVHPPDWQQPKPAPRYNLVVIGGGTAGLVTAAGAAGLGAKVALVERHLLGGDCLNVGCVPSKSLIRSARAIAAVREAGEFGVRVPTGVTFDFAAAMARLRRLRADIAPNDSAARFRDLGVDVFLGNAQFTAPGKISVGDATLLYSKAVIATGARAATPAVEGISTVPYLTNETLFSLTELPRRLAIFGGGPIGCEMAQCFARFGSEVTLIETNPGILKREDQDAARLIENSLVKDGVKLVCNARKLKVGQVNGQTIVSAESNGNLIEICVDKLLVAAGRTPNVEGLGLENVQVEFDRRGVRVNDRLQTTNSAIYACGDVCSRFQFTHAADFMARTVIQNSLFRGRARVSSLIIPWCTYTSPELAHVGCTPSDAKEQGLAIDTFTQDLRHVDRAILDGETDGFVRVHVARGTDKIIGATVVAAHAGDMIGEITLAMKGGLGLKTVGSTIHPYPTQTEAIRKVGDLYSRTRLTPFVKSLFHRVLAWQR
jgi:pyruvate/2-oxoglutarate dehydrogenase complex dihydrolipoamide dehydrogenase (E3) component